MLLLPLVLTIESLYTAFGCRSGAEIFFTFILSFMYIPMCRKYASLYESRFDLSTHVPLKIWKMYRIWLKEIVIYFIKLKLPSFFRYQA